MSAFYESRCVLEKKTGFLKQWNKTESRAETTDASDFCEDSNRQHCINLKQIFISITDEMI